jgi:transposase
MKVEVFNAHNKYTILKHALKENNVSQTYELLGISRTTYYNWNRAYEKHGMMGLAIKKPEKRKMRNKVNKTTEDEILSHVQKFPTDGPKRIYYDLRAKGFDIGESGIYNILNRYDLSTKVKRIDYSKNKVTYVTEKQKNKKITLYFEHTKESYPGYVLIQRMDFLDTYNGIDF